MAQKVLTWSTSQLSDSQCNFHVPCLRSMFIFVFIGDTMIRSSPKHSHFTDGDHLLTREGPEKVGSFYSKTLTLITETGQK